MHKALLASFAFARTSVTVVLILSIVAVVPVRGADPAIPDGVSEDHPLVDTYNLVLERMAGLRETVKDYEVLLVKRERIEGRLQRYQYIAAKIRRPAMQDGQQEPFAVQLRYLSPKRLAGRRVLYVEGKYDSKMLVRTNGPLLGNAIVRLTPRWNARHSREFEADHRYGFRENATVHSGTAATGDVRGPGR